MASTSKLYKISRRRNMELKNEKVLLMGLGLLGGGVATAKWLVARGARLTVTDLKGKKALADSLRALGAAKKKIKFVFSEHRPRDFENNDIIVVNPGVAYNNKFLLLAKKKKKIILNELGLFALSCLEAEYLAVTGTRGKTTTTAWAHYFMTRQFPRALVGGNNPRQPLLALAPRARTAKVVLETPSFLLENLPPGLFHPHVAVITNVYRDHLNRYRDFAHYAKTKAEIFKNQTKNDFLILNADNVWTKYFVKLQPRARVLFFSTKKKLAAGAMIKDGKIVVKVGGVERALGSAQNFIKNWGQHNLENLLAACLAAMLSGVAPAKIKKAVAALPGVAMRQQLIHKRGSLLVYNDSAATSPEATMAAVARFKKSRPILIAGGTDGDLDYSAWAKVIKKYIQPENLILLAGSATKKMTEALKLKKLKVFETLKACVEAALARTRKEDTIIFSPGAKSFEKFKNEFDRGQQFNKLIYEKFKRGL